MTDPLSPDTGGQTGAWTGGQDPPTRPGVLPPLPDLTEVDLETLRTLDHPVLADMVAELRERAERPREMLWGFTNSSDPKTPPRASGIAPGAVPGRRDPSGA